MWQAPARQAGANLVSAPPPSFRLASEPSIASCSLQHSLLPHRLWVLTRHPYQAGLRPDRVLPVFQREHARPPNGQSSQFRLVPPEARNLQSLELECRQQSPHSVAQRLTCDRRLGSRGHLKSARSQSQTVLARMTVLEIHHCPVTLRQWQGLESKNSR